MKAMVIGNPASGKSTFATGLGNMLNIPVIHSDVEFDLAGGNRRQSDENILRQADQEAWILEGNAFADPKFEEVMSRADQLFVMRLNPFRAVARHIARNRRVHRGQEARLGRDTTHTNVLRSPLQIGGRVINELVRIPPQVDNTIKSAEQLGIEVTIFHGHEEASAYLSSAFTGPISLSKTQSTPV